MTRLHCQGGDQLATPNYQYQKRQKDLEKKRKQEEKRLKKLAKKAAQSDPNAPPTPGGGETQGNT